MINTTYSEAILSGFDYLLKNYPEVFILGQGLWSPWYVGNTMKNLDKKYGKERIIDTPVSESACTGAAVGASICGMKPIIVHPRMDFMLYAMDAIVNQAAKWSHMFGGQAHPGVTIRGIINRGGEQGAQHSQALHSWFAHIPGLKVVIPSSVADARNLLIASVLAEQPVIYIDDRWLYNEKDICTEINLFNLDEQEPKKVISGNDMTIISSGFSTKIAKDAINTFKIKNNNFSIELFDLRVVNPIKYESLTNSILKTKRFMVIDGGWKTCGLGSEIISSIIEIIGTNVLLEKPINLSLNNCPAPSSKTLEKKYYLSATDILDTLNKVFNPQNKNY